VAYLGARWPRHYIKVADIAENVSNGEVDFSSWCDRYGDFFSTYEAWWCEANNFERIVRGTGSVRGGVRGGGGRVDRGGGGGSSGPVTESYVAFRHGAFAALSLDDASAAATVSSTARGFVGAGEGTSERSSSRPPRMLHTSFLHPAPIVDGGSEDDHAGAATRTEGTIHAQADDDDDGDSIEEAPEVARALCIEGLSLRPGPITEAHDVAGADVFRGGVGQASAVATIAHAGGASSELSGARGGGRMRAGAEAAESIISEMLHVDASLAAAVAGPGGMLFAAGASSTSTAAEYAMAGTQHNLSMRTPIRTAMLHSKQYAFRY